MCIISDGEEVATFSVYASGCWVTNSACPFPRVLFPRAGYRCHYHVRESYGCRVSSWARTIKLSRGTGSSCAVPVRWYSSNAGQTCNAPLSYKGVCNPVADSAVCSIRFRSSLPVGRYCMVCRICPTKKNKSSEPSAGLSGHVTASCSRRHLTNRCKACCMQGELYSGLLHQGTKGAAEVLGDVLPQSLYYASCWAT